MGLIDLASGNSLWEVLIIINRKRLRKLKK